MKSSLFFNLGCACIIVFLCPGCSSTEQTNPSVQTKVLVKPTTKPTAKPTPTATPTRAQRRRIARAKARAEREARRQREKAAAEKRANVAFDVPALLGKSIEQIRATLGQNEGPGPEDDDGEMAWSKSKGALLVHYDQLSRESNSFFVNDQYGQPLTDKSLFLLMGNLREDDPRYTLEFVPLMGSDTEWIGVRILPN